MSMRRFLAAALTAVMLLTTLPAAALAANGGTTPEESGKLFLDKTAELQSDGSYTIKMEAYATGTTKIETVTKGVPLDIVLVLDQSGSMTKELGNGTRQDALKSAAKNFVDSVYQDGQKAGVEHRIGIVTFAGAGNEESSKYDYMNSGIYNEKNEKSEFIGYQEASQGTTTYKPYDGALDPNGTYYVQNGSEYVKLDYVKDADSYVEVPNPDTGRTDLYGLVNGEYKLAAYGEVTSDIYTPAADYHKDDGKTYYTADGKPLTWVEEVEEKYVKVTSGDFNGTEYYIDTNKNPKNPNWVKLTYNGLGWDSSDKKSYKKEEPKNGKYQFRTMKFDASKRKYYDAYTLNQQPTGTWFLSADGKTPATDVYIKESKTEFCWNVNGTPVNTLYELQQGAGKWQYTVYTEDFWGDLIPDTRDLTNEQVYVADSSASAYGSALIPVADGVNGAGNKKTCFDKSISKLSPEGPTRVGIGMEMANNIFAANPIPAGSERQRVVIVFTDGQPGYSGYEKSEAGLAVNNAYETKNTYGAKVYTIGLYSKEETEQKEFMQHLSSDYPDAQYANEKFTGTKVTDKEYHSKVSDAAALDKVFQTISQEIGGSSTSVELTTNSVLQDVMANSFALTAGSAVKVSVVPSKEAITPGNITWGKPIEVLNVPTPAGKTTEQSGNVNVAGTDMTLKVTANGGKVEVTGFDYKNQYIAKAHAGSKLVVEITGVQALPSAVTDKLILTNKGKESGIFDPVSQAVIPFPKKNWPKTYIPSKTYVMDYAKPAELPFDGFTAKSINAEGYAPFGTSPVTDISDAYGSAAVAGSKLTYTPTTMQWDGAETFYAFGQTTDPAVKGASANANGNVWAKINVIPANNIYYEDTFETDSTTGTVGIVYGGTWDEVGTPANNAGSVNDGIHGWVPALSDNAADTDGTAHHTKANSATAQFTFTGTGVDVYSRTSSKTCVIRATLKQGGKIIKAQIVDTLSASGEYYQIPTLSFAGLKHGTYTVEIKVTNSAADRMDFYLDGVRVYHPMQNDSAYAPNEQGASFIEVRQELLDAKSFSAEENGVSHGAVFIDQIKEGQGTEVGTGTKTTVVGTYKDYGPKHEVYLDRFQSVSFKVSPGFTYAIGLKSPSGKAATASYPGANGKMQVVDINHSGDMYYAVAPASNGIITISNMGSELLSITKLKVTSPSGTAVTADEVFEEVPVPVLLAAAQESLDQIPAEPEKPQPPKNPIKDFFDNLFDKIGGWLNPWKRK